MKQLICLMIIASNVCYVIEGLQNIGLKYRKMPVHCTKAPADLFKMTNSPKTLRKPNNFNISEAGNSGLEAFFL